jgi:hypothetical protein
MDERYDKNIYDNGDGNCWEGPQILVPPLPCWINQEWRHQEELEVG